MSQRTSRRHGGPDPPSPAEAIGAYLEGICAADPDVDQTSIVDGGGSARTCLKTTIPTFIRRHESLTVSDDLLITPLPGDLEGFIAVKA